MNLPYDAIAKRMVKSTSYLEIERLSITLRGRRMEMGLQTCNTKGWSQTKHGADKDKQSQWISVEDRLPEEAQFILIWGSHTTPWMSQFLEDQFIDVEDNDWVAGVTHWMPLPSPPQETE